VRYSVYRVIGGKECEAFGNVYNICSDTKNPSADAMADANECVLR
jgi:hypothetical protein